MDTTKVVISVPKELKNAIANADPNKPYDICLVCDFLSHSCDGPNFMAMEYCRWVEWANLRIKKMGVTRAKVAEEANLPLSTLNSILSGRTHDIKMSTMRDITKVLVGGSWGQYPCHIAALLMNSEELRVDEQIVALQQQLVAEREKSDELRAKLNRYHEFHEKELDTVRKEAQAKIDWLKEHSKTMDGHFKDQKAIVTAKEAVIVRKEKTIAALCVIIALLGSLMIGTLIYDKTHPDMGWIQTAGYSISDSSSSL